MEKQTVYIPVDVNKRLPVQDKLVTWVMGDGIASTGHMDEYCGNWWVYLKMDNGESETFSPYDFTHWLEKKENVYVFTPEQFEKLIGDAFDAGVKRSSHSTTRYKDGFNWGLSEKTTPTKEQYLNNLTDRGGGA